MRKILAVSLSCLSLLCGCASPATSPTPSSPQALASSSPATLLETSSSSAPGPTIDSAASSPSPAPPAEAATLPVRGSAYEIGRNVRMTAGPTRGVYVLISMERGSILALLDSTGMPRPGWPIALDGTYCSLPASATDGSVRVVCAFNSDPVNRAFAFAPDGRSIDGWPVEVPAAEAARVVDDRLYLVTYVVDDEQVINGYRLIAVAPDGTTRTGKPIERPESSQQDSTAQLGPDGTGYLLAYPNEATGATKITAFDLAGVRRDWLVNVKGRPSGLSFGLAGSVYVTEGIAGRSRILAFGPDGRPLPAGSEVLPVAATRAYEGAGPFGGPPPPVVGEEAMAFLVSEQGGTTIYEIDGAGHVQPGWPYRDSIGLQWSYVGPGETGTPSWRSDPVVGPGTVLYLLHPPRSPNVGGTVVAIWRDAKVRPGWPVELKRPGAEFWSIVVGSDGTAYALAIEPEAGGRSSASILAIAPDSTILSVTTIIEP